MVSFYFVITYNNKEEIISCCIKGVIAKAKKESLKYNRPGSAHVCACAKLGQTKWLGYNNKKSHPSARKLFKNGQIESCCLHAEMDAIVKVPRSSRSKIRLFVFRFLKNGDLSMAKPCDMCLKFLEQEGIKAKNVYYTNWNGIWENLDSNSLKKVS